METTTYHLNTGQIIKDGFSYPHNVFGATGDKISQSSHIICGGVEIETENIAENCYKTNKQGYEKVGQTLRPRAYASSLVLNASALLITGGYGENSSEVIDWKRMISTPGPLLPHDIYQHCLVKLDEQNILLIGIQSLKRGFATMKQNCLFQGLKVCVYKPAVYLCGAL